MPHTLKLLKTNGRLLCVLVFATTITVSNLLVANVFAAHATSNSIQMSTSAPSATSATYTIKFTTATTSNIQGVVIDFCSNSPILGTSCTAPSGMTVGSTIGTIVGLNPTSGWAGAVSGGKLTLTNASGASVTSGTAVTIPISGFTNPSTTGTFYARIVTYATNTAANAYTSASPGTHVDDSGVALSTTTSIQVSATVAESLTFCVSAAAPGNGCTSTTTPSIELGHGTPVILDTSAVDTATVYFQLSTNASGATAVNMKGSSANLTSGSNTIPATGATAATITAGTAAFGMRSSGGTGGTGTVTATAPYNSGSQYGMDDTGSGVTATYGDQIASASGAILNVNTPLVFAATAGATTPAGIYTASYSLIATSSY